MIDEISKWLFVAVTAILILTLSSYVLLEPYGFTYSQTYVSYYNESPPIKHCSFDVINGTKCKILNVPYGQENMWVYRDQSFLAKIVAKLYDNQLLVGIILFIWFMQVNFKKYRGMIDKWKKHTN